MVKIHKNTVLSLPIANIPMIHVIPSSGINMIVPTTADLLIDITMMHCTTFTCTL